MEKNESELEKKLEEEKESTMSDSEIIRHASKFLPSQQELIEGETVSESNSLKDVLKILEEKTKELEELKDRYLRVCAEYDNYRKRTARERKEFHETATEHLIKDLLPVLDNFERALQHAPDPNDAFISGIRMVFSQLKDALMARGLLPIDSVGQQFDPNVHEALAQMESELPEGTVVQEYEKGYRLGKRILRPAKVVVSKSSDDGIVNNRNNDNSVSS
ncbi:MAG TPA: nucleotide exchange factor GrpE [Candidatus Hydrogenedens sp.]|nr:nucleotide exchange factor GrpE [Candidatus Hydrogenedens sp.]